MAGNLVSGPRGNRARRTTTLWRSSGQPLRTPIQMDAAVDRLFRRLLIDHEYEHGQYRSAGHGGRFPDRCQHHRLGEPCFRVGDHRTSLAAFTNLRCLWQEEAVPMGSYSGAGRTRSISGLPRPNPTDSGQVPYSHRVFNGSGQRQRIADAGLPIFGKGKGPGNHQHGVRPWDWAQFLSWRRSYRRIRLAGPLLGPFARPRAAGIPHLEGGKK